ncbi:DUF1266 domain-containing protein [Pseudomonas sp. TE3610]
MEETQHHWLYCLSAPMAALNGASFTAPGYFDDERTMDLGQGWGIHNREQLLDMLRMADHGHADALNGAYWHFARCLPTQWQQTLDTLTPHDRLNHEFAARTFGDCGYGGTRAWDLARMSLLLRNAVREGWINLEESLWLHGRLALRARHFYNSWESYVSGFMFGKMLWNCGNDDAQMKAYELDRQGAEHWNRCIIGNLVQRASALFASLPWDLSLDFGPRPDSLEEGSWS